MHTGGRINKKTCFIAVKLHGCFGQSASHGGSSLGASLQSLLILVRCSTSPCKNLVVVCPPRKIEYQRAAMQIRNPSAC